MFEQDPSLQQLGVAKLREALYEHKGIQVSIKRLRTVKPKVFGAEMLSPARMDPTDPGPPEGERHDIHKHFSEDDWLYHVIQGILRDSPHGHHLPLPTLTSAVKRETGLKLSIDDVRSLRDMVLEMHRSAVPKEMLTGGASLDDFQVDAMRTSDTGSWTTMVLRKGERCLDAKVCSKTV